MSGIGEVVAYSERHNQSNRIPGHQKIGAKIIAGFSKTVDFLVPTDHNYILTEAEVHRSHVSRARRIGVATTALAVLAGGAVVTGIADGGIALARGIAHASQTRDRHELEAEHQELDKCLPADMADNGHSPEQAASDCFNGDEPMTLVAVESYAVDHFAADGNN